MEQHTSSGNQQRILGFKQMKYGFFVHVVFGNGVHPNIYTINRDGSIPSTLDALANAFDAEGFANDLSAFGVEYVIFTAWHANMNTLYPSKKMAEWLGEGHTSHRDLIGEMIASVKSKGISIWLYTHPRVGHDFSESDAIASGWGGGGGAFDPNPNPKTFDSMKWNHFINDIYGELIDRYGADIDGLYWDEGSEHGDSDQLIDYARLRETILSRNPNLVLMQNYYGSLYSADIGNKEYSYQVEFASTDENTWPSNSMPVSTVMGGQFWAIRPQGQQAVKFTAEGIFKYTVLQAGVNTDGGGTCWSAGPYADGSGWEDSVVSTMRQVGDYLAPIAESIKNTYPSTSFVTPPGSTIDSIPWGVATKSLDEDCEYIHVLKPPSGMQLSLPLPADGKQFSEAKLVSNGNAVALCQSENGVLLTLLESDTWNALDTVIELRAKN